MNNTHSTLGILATWTILLISPQAALAGGVADVDADDRDVLVVRYACLIGGREAGTAPTSAGALSRKELVSFLLEWQPGTDNDEMRQVFALNDLGELTRQASQLPLGGGAVSGRFALGESHLEIDMKIRPARRETWMGMGTSYRSDVGSGLRILADLRLGGERLSEQTAIHPNLGERSIITYTDTPEAPFLFLVVEVDRVSTEELERRGLRHSWSRDIRLVDGEEVSEPVAIEKTPPSYTVAAKEAKHQGRVVLRAVIDEEGRVDDIEVIEGQPYGLSEAAISSIRTWRFHPALYQGEPVAVFYILTVNFRLT